MSLIRTIFPPCSHNSYTQLMHFHIKDRFITEKDETSVKVTHDKMGTWECACSTDQIAVKKRVEQYSGTG